MVQQWIAHTGSVDMTVGRDWKLQLWAITWCLSWVAYSPTSFMETAIVCMVCGIPSSILCIATGSRWSFCCQGTTLIQYLYSCSIIWHRSKLLLNGPGRLFTEFYGRHMANKLGRKVLAEPILYGSPLYWYFPLSGSREEQTKFP